MDSRASSETLYPSSPTALDEPVHSIERHLIITEYQRLVTEWRSAKRNEFQQTIDALSSSSLPPPSSNTPLSYKPLVFHALYKADPPKFQETVNEWDVDDNRETQVEIEAVKYISLVPSDNLDKGKDKDEKQPPHSFAPHPPYHSCTPASTSIARFPGVNPDSLDFILYADMPRFREFLMDLLTPFETFTWQHLQDPDLTVLYRQLVQSLCEGGPKMSRKELDWHLPLAFKPQLRTYTLYNPHGENDQIHYPSLFQKSQQRDLGSTIPLASIPPEMNTERLPLEFFGPILRHVILSARLFCHRCHVYFCLLHELSTAPTLNPSALESTTKGNNHKTDPPCQPRHLCYKTHRPTWGQASLGSDDRADRVADVFKLDPHASPCDVAVITRVPCYKVHAYQQSTMEDNASTVFGDEEPSSLKQRPKPKLKRSELEDMARLRERDAMPFFIPVRPCMHKGPCQVEDVCDCHRWKQHCTSACLCSQSCGMRWKGCRQVCANSPCRIDKCPCYIRGKECEPELCHPTATVTDKPKKHRCKNHNGQHDPPAQIAIKRGAYGLGAFAMTNIPANRFIGEYTGVISNEVHNTQQAPEAIMFFINFNYIFELHTSKMAIELKAKTADDSDPDPVLDSFCVGNETRYLNHGELESKVNVRAETIFIRGDHRILFSTTKAVKAGQELFLNYGRNYFKRHLANAESSEEQQAPPPAPSPSLPPIELQEESSGSEYDQLQSDDEE